MRTTATTPKLVCQTLGLDILPVEGGWYRELREDKQNGDVGNMKNNSQAAADLKSQSIYFLLSGREKSKWHQTKEVEECLTFLKGNTPMILHEIDNKGNYKVG